MRIGNDWVMYDDDEAAGGLGSSAPDTASENYDDDEAGADGLGSSAPDTASNDEALGLVVVDAELPMPPVVAGADFPGCFAPDTASYDKTLGPVFRMLCSGYRQWE